MPHWLLACFAVQLVSVGANFNYCEITCANNTAHTVCKYPAGGARICDNNEMVFLMRRDKMYILEMLNNVRQFVAKGREASQVDFRYHQPPASNMMKLVWDGELGMMAKRWADQCDQPLHDTCRRAMDGQEVGQTSYVSTYRDSAASNIDKRMERSKRIYDALKSWFMEIDDLNPKNVRSYDPATMAATDNYTQIAWGSTVYVGCGYTEFAVGSGNIRYRFICNYKPAGNIPGLPLYRVGEFCTSCPPKANCSITWTALCFNGEPNDFVDDTPSRGVKSRSPIVPLCLLLFVSVLYHQSLLQN